MTALSIVRIVGILACGLFAGILLGDRMGSTYARPSLSASAFVQFQQIVHVHFVRMMPPLMLSSIAAALAWLVLLRAQWNSPQFLLVAAATAAMICGAVLTRLVNIPINNQLMTWSIAAPPANLKEIWSRWEHTHTIRTIFWLAAFALEVIAVSLAASPNAM
jgi:hypothetical protein